MVKTYKWCAVDGEGDAGEIGLLGTAFYSDQGGVYLTDKNATKDLLFEYAEQGYTFLCHNAEYDIPVVFEQLGIQIEITYYNDRFHHGSWKFNPKRPATQIWDTLDLSGGIGLAALGEALQLPKYKTPKVLTKQDYNKYDWKCTAHDRWECVECYAVRDAEITYTFMLELEKTLAGWSVQPSPRIAGISMDVWKSLENPVDVALPGSYKSRKSRKRLSEDDTQDRHLSYTSKMLARKAYMGGRVETIKLGYYGPCFVADVVSMYPSVMRDTPYPDPTSLVFMKDIAPSSLPIQSEGVALVDITIPVSYIPPLPYTYKGQRIYPIGRLVGCWTLLELRYAIECGAVINRVHKVVYATRNVHPFTFFIDVMWASRVAHKKDKDPRALFDKLVMNNLYGRMGVRDKPTRLIVRDVPPGFDSRTDFTHGWIESGDKLHIFREDAMNFDSAFTNVMWAAQTTAAARIKLHQLILLQGDGMLYCDTDSIFSKFPIIGLSEGLGGLEMKAIYDAVIIAQPKMYAWKTRIQDMDESWSTVACKPHGIKSCDDCRWYAKAKGVPQEVALQFLYGEDVGFDRAIKPREELTGRHKAGTWEWTTKHTHPTPFRRHPLAPQALYTPFGASDTAAPVVGPIFTKPK